MGEAVPAPRRPHPLGPGVGRPAPRPDGTPRFVVAQIEDITARRDAEQAPAAAQEAALEQERATAEQRWAPAPEQGPRPNIPRPRPKQRLRIPVTGATSATSSARLRGLPKRRPPLAGAHQMVQRPHRRMPVTLVDTGVPTTPELLPADPQQPRRLRIDQLPRVHDRLARPLGGPQQPPADRPPTTTLQATPRDGRSGDRHAATPRQRLARTRIPHVRTPVGSSSNSRTRAIASVAAANPERTPRLSRSSRDCQGRVPRFGELSSVELMRRRRPATAAGSGDAWPSPRPRPVARTGRR
jgi:hypothetical protein